MKRIWIGMISLLLVCGGCSQSAPTETYKVSTDTLLEKITNKETFVAVINQNDYQAGELFQTMLEPFMEENKRLAIYEVMLDEQGEKRQDTYLALEKIANSIPEFDGTIPSMLYFKEGKVEKQISGNISEVAWKNFLKECDILNGEIEEENIDKLAESENFITDFKQFYQDYDANKELYVLVCENDRYSIRFSETLKKQIEEKDLSVYVLHLYDASIYESEAMQEIMSSLSIHMTPTLLHIKDKEILKRLEDNASEQELKEWLSTT